MGQQLLVGRWLNDQEIASGIARVLHVEPARVLVVTDLHWPLAVVDSAVVVERWGQQGDFPLTLLLVAQREDIAAPLAPENERATVRALAEVWNAAILVPDERGIPWRKWLFPPDGEPTRVMLDAEALSEDPERVLLSRQAQPTQTG